MNFEALETQESAMRVCHTYLGFPSLSSFGVCNVKCDMSHLLELVSAMVPWLVSHRTTLTA